MEILFTALYSGYIPVAPGTFGSLWAIPLGYLLSGLSSPVRMILFFIFLVVAVLASTRGEEAFGVKDPKEVVIDEVVGFTFLLLLIPLTLPSLLLGLLLFRVFDILKPFPIRWVEESLPSGLGVVVDDLVASIYAFFTFGIIYNGWGWWP